MGTEIPPRPPALEYGARERLHTVLSEVIEKVTDRTGEAKIQRIEKGLTRAIVKAWTARATQAISSALKGIPDSNEPFTEKDAKAVMKRLEFGMAGVSDDVSARMTKDLIEIYRTSKLAFAKRFTLGVTKTELIYTTYEQIGLTKYRAHKREVKSINLKKITKAGIGISFDIVDEQLMAQMGKLAKLSIGDHFPQNLKPLIGAMIKEAVIDRGLPKREAGIYLREELTRKLGGTNQAVPQWIRDRGQEMVNNYFIGLNATHVTMSRNVGNILAMEEVGIARYVWASIIDQTTTPVCSMMNGRTFEMRFARKTIDAIMEADTVADLKRVAPFRKDISSLIGGRGVDDPRASEVLAANGVAIPPIHFRCRSEVHPA